MYLRPEDDWGEKPETPKQNSNTGFLLDPMFLWNLNYLFGYMVMCGIVMMPTALIRMNAAFIPR